MSVVDALRGLLGLGGPRVRVHLLLRGRIGEGWLDVDRTFSLPEGATLASLIEAAAREGIDLEGAIAKSPHLASTLMWNGERRPLADCRDSPLADGDQIYLLSSIAGGLSGCAVG